MLYTAVQFLFECFVICSRKYLLSQTTVAPALFYFANAKYLMTGTVCFFDVCRGRKDPQVNLIILTLHTTYVHVAIQ